MSRASRSTDWQTLSCERIRDGYYLLVAKAANGVRWRYSVTPLEYVQRPRRAVQFAKASGYMRSFERAVRAVEAACDGLLKSDKNE